ncbi:MAG: CoA pyrophosphatase [Candidatus Binatia bacterium]|nr:CoA pyrophosphatase [Candidatus Binatia bacterium]
MEESERSRREATKGAAGNEWGRWSAQEIAERLRERPVHLVKDPPDLPRAAVALILRDGVHGSEFVAIHRAHRRGDPWSGHMALPGGRQQPGDAHLIATAVRETREEIGVDLERAAEVVGELDELRAVGRGQLLDLVIRPVVFVLRAPVQLVPNPEEVQSALWIPLAALRHNSKPYRHPTNAQVGFVPAFEFQGHTIWGLTHRILSGLLDILAKQTPPAEEG